MSFCSHIKSRQNQVRALDKMIKPNDTIGLILLLIVVCIAFAAVLMRMFLRTGPIFRNSNNSASLSYYYMDQDEHSASSPSTDVYHMDERGEHRQQQPGEGSENPERFETV